ncbi:glucose PTS transporter subunit IIA [Arcanobacterium wilhelmae]|uniref:glucose PTS transporter subunit IIA n=1 Tax=Arcanobacterium wilhelmae TaxID=1803177 RepID=UPI002415304E|nr:glucose PTS transporter subunit IIA [Arcanobacterium wilhelmae]WFN90885.1 glucose PTS transporter subunit IIA [Arcanobacterium wilhelmae]
MAKNSQQEVLDGIGGMENIATVIHCATRLRFQLKDNSAVNREKIAGAPDVIAAIPQAGDRYQVVVRGNVADYFSKFMALPAMRNFGRATDDELKEQLEKKGRGKSAVFNAFSEYLSDAIRPSLGVLLGASLVMALAIVLQWLGVPGFASTGRTPERWFVESLWAGVFFFLPVLVAYNASVKMKVDGWLGAAVMLALMTPFTGAIRTLAAHTSGGTAGLEELGSPAGTLSFTLDVFGLPLHLPSYGGRVLVPLAMVPVLAWLYHWLKRHLPETMQLMFVPFLTLLVMVPLTAFVIGPAFVWLGNEIGDMLGWVNRSAPYVFALSIPLLYPFIVPLGLHWPLNVLMLVNLSTLGFDFLQGPMGAWNFACYGAAAGVAIVAWRAKDHATRSTARSALWAGLIGGTSEPALYGVHLRYRRVYPALLVGCAAGGLSITIGGWLTGGVTTRAFVFSSLLTIPVFDPAGTYLIAIAVAFFVAMVGVLIVGYREPGEKPIFGASANGTRFRVGQLSPLMDDADAPVTATAPAGVGVRQAPDVGGADVAGVPARTSGSDRSEAGAMSEAPVFADEGPGSGLAHAFPLPSQEGQVTGAANGLHASVYSPVDGRIVALEETSDAIFASRALGNGVGIVPASGEFSSPVAGVVTAVQPSGHAYGIRSDDGVEVLIHIGIDTVEMAGRGFTAHVERGQRVDVGDPLASADLAAIEAAGHSTTTFVVVTNTRALAQVTPEAPGEVAEGGAVIAVAL